MNGNKHGRRNWTLSLTLAVCVAAAATAFGLRASNEPVATDRFYLVNSAGPVLFDHGKHQEFADSCATCHHYLYSSEQSLSCEECHGDEFAAADFEHGELTDYHVRECSTCHEQAIEDDEASSCRGCHPPVQEAEAAIIPCSQCHDDDYEPDMLVHAEYVEIEDHSCLSCHAPPSVSESYHLSCTPCHLDSEPERFTNVDGTENCSGCHLR